MQQEELQEVFFIIKKSETMRGRQISQINQILCLDRTLCKQKTSNQSYGRDSVQDIMKNTESTKKNAFLGNDIWRW